MSTTPPPAAPVPSGSVPSASVAAASVPSASVASDAAPASAVPAGAAPLDAPSRRNRVGITGFVLVLASFVIPVIVLIVAIIIIANDPNPPTGDNIGWAGLGALLFMFIAAAIASPLAVIGGILGIISLTLKNRSKIFGVLAIVLGLPYGIVMLLSLPAAISLAGLG